MASDGTSQAVATVEAFMAAFIEAWPTGDASGLARFFSDDAVFHNGPLPPVTGRDAIVATCAEQMTLGGEVSVDIHHMLADGALVMTERTDYVRLGGKALALRIMGAFEVHRGVITAWRDYFDAGEFSSQMSAP